MKLSCTCEVIMRLQKGYFSSASMHAKKLAASSKDGPRVFMLAKSQTLMPCSPTITFKGVKSFNTADDGSTFLDVASERRAPVMMVRMAPSSNPSPLQLSHSRSMSASKAPPSKGCGISAEER